METLTATALPIPFVPSNKNYALPDPKVITCLISPSVNKYIVKNQNLFPIDTQRFQPLSIKSYINEAANDTSDDNELIQTPPLSAGVTETPTSAKLFTPFQLNDEIDSEIAESTDQTVTVEAATEKADYDILENSSKSPLHLDTIQISSDILVSMLEREVEIRDLVKANEEFFATLKLVFHSRWEKFQEILYTKREELSDKEWMLQLSGFLTANPPLFMKFKDIVGYLGDIPSDGYYIDTFLIRDHPEKLATFEVSYPEFFADAFKNFDRNHEQYAEFKRTLFATRQEICDEEWEDRLYGILSRSQSLLGQFEDIVACALEGTDNM